MPLKCHSVASSRALVSLVNTPEIFTCWLLRRFDSACVMCRQARPPAMQPSMLKRPIRWRLLHLAGRANRGLPLLPQDTPLMVNPCQGTHPVYIKGTVIDGLCIPALSDMHMALTLLRYHGVLTALHRLGPAPVLLGGDKGLLNVPSCSSWRHV